MAMTQRLAKADTLTAVPIADPDDARRGLYLVTRFEAELADRIRVLQRELSRSGGDSIVGADFGLRPVMEQVFKVAATDAPVLLLGETGVGKDVIAKAIHAISARRDGPFIAVNCGAIAESLVESELFGHEKGAFTGALTTKRGRFERANNGTIFLDEIGELPPHLQVRLLRVLQSNEVERVGASKTTYLDIRVIAASNRDLSGMVREQRFREDLWFRLNVFPIHVPPLRDRVTDIPELTRHFLRTKTRDLKLPAVPELSHDSIEALSTYQWPGNVRELGNIVERALILNPAGPINFTELLPKTADNSDSGPDGSERTMGSVSEWGLDDAMKRHIVRCLEVTKGRVEGSGGAADLLKVNPSTLRHRMKRLGVRSRR